MEIRELSKLKGTYVEGFRARTGWPDPFPFGHETATGQLTSRRPNVQNCFSGDTEILTKSGWTAFDVLPDDLEVAQYDTNTGEITFVRPQQVVRQWADELLHIHTQQQIDLLVTPEHECLLVNRKSGRKAKVPAATYPLDHQQIHAGAYVGGAIPFRASQIVLVAALQADGHVREDGYGYEFIFAKAHKIERLLSALEDEGVSHRIYPQGDQTRIFVPDRGIPGWWRNKKYFGPWLLNLDKHAFAAMAEEIFFWDSCWTRRSNYSSNLKQNADWAQILQVLTGKRARIRHYGTRNWQVDVAPHSYSLTTNCKIDRVPGKTRVYCATVPTGNVVVRRAGRVMITGNCPKIGHGGGASSQFKQLATEFRGMVEAQPGHWLVEADYKSAHALTLGFEGAGPRLLPPGAHRHAQLPGGCRTAQTRRPTKAARTPRCGTESSPEVVPQKLARQNRPPVRRHPQRASQARDSRVWLCHGSKYAPRHQPRELRQHGGGEARDPEPG